MTVEMDNSDSDISSGSENENYDSDEELQKAFAAGKLQGSTFKEIIQAAPPINDQSGMEAKLAEFTRSDLPWLERLDLTVEPAIPVPGATDIDDEEKIHDDFKRELYFYRLAQNCVLEGIPKLHQLGIPTKRPDDYFAQMVKSDSHMTKIREKLLSKNAATERVEKAKKIREMKKLGKKVQTEVLKGRQKEKKAMLEAVKKYRKGQQDKLDFLNDDVNNKKNKSSNKQTTRINRKRDWKNQKFGFGGQKKRSKSNTKESSADFREYDTAKHGMTARKAKLLKKTKKNVRPGKSKRQKMKSKKR